MNLYHIVCGNGHVVKNGSSETGVSGWQVTRDGFKSGKLKPTIFTNEAMAFDAFERAKQRFKYVTLFMVKDVDEKFLNPNKIEDYINSLRWETLEEIY